MKRLALTVLAISVLGSAASAASVEFRGRFCLTAINAACTAEGWQVGDCTNARFSPPNLGDNGPGSKFTIIGDFFGENYSLANGSFVSGTFKPVSGAGVGRGSFTFNAQMQFVQQAPQAIAAATPFVNITGAINNFDGIAGCLVSFRSALLAR